MLEGRQRKRLIKLARRVPIEDVRRFVCPDGDDIPSYFVLQEFGQEVVRSWHFGNGDPDIYEVIMEDEVFCAAMVDYLKSRDLVFSSDDDAIVFANRHIVPKLNRTKAEP